MNLFHLAVHRPVATWMIAIALAVFGLVSYQRLPLNLMPDLSYPAVTVRTEAAGYAPEEVEQELSRPIEEALATTQGLAELESRSRAGVSDVVLEFRWGTDMDRALQDIRERLQITFLPDDATRPLILRYDPALDPILRIVLSRQGASDDADEATLALLRETAEQQIKRELEAMEGVAAVTVRGGLEREVHVSVREDWLAAQGLTIDAVISSLRAENVNLPGGTIREGDHEYLVRTLGELKTLPQIAALEIPRPDGRRVPLTEVATISEGFREREVVTRLDGAEAVEIEIYKAADANIVRITEDLLAKIGPPPEEVMPAFPGMPPPDTIRSRLPEGARLTLLENQASFIEASLDNLRSTAVGGALLSMIVLYLFLRDFRATAIISAATGLSIVWAFGPLYLLGVSLNLMSLGGLALGIGMFVDNAIVTLENIQVNIENGMERREAAIKGTSEVAVAITASSLTNIAVFAPIAFVEGIAGQVFGDLSWAVVSSVCASLLVSLFFVPVLAAAAPRLPAYRAPMRGIARSSRFLAWRQFRAGLADRRGWRRLAWLPWGLARAGLRLGLELLATLFVASSAAFARLFVAAGQRALPPLARLADAAAVRFQARYERLAAWYGRTLTPLLARPGRVIAAATIAILLTLPLAGRLSQTLIPELHQGRFIAEIALPVGTPLPRTAGVVAHVEQELADHPEIAHVHAIIGAERRADSRPDEGEHTARLLVELTPASVGGGDLAAREDRVSADVREIIRAAAGDRPLELRLSRPSLFSSRTPIEVALYHTDLGRLQAESAAVQEELAELPGLRDVRSSLQRGYPEIQITFRRDLLHRFGLDTASVASRVREKIQGEPATAISRQEQRVDLVVRLAEEDRRSIDQLRRLNVNPAVTPAVPLESVAILEEGVGPSEIRRIDQRRAAVVTANLQGFDLSGQADAIAAALRRMDLSGVEWEILGQNAELQRSSRSLWAAVGLAVFLVYVIMASTFESVLHPFVIMFSVPLALVGVVLTLWLSGIPVSVVVLLGAIVLVGVVVNNAIVLVDAINRLREEGMPRNEAIEAACKLRLRPILITAATTVLGLLPLSLGIGEGAEIQQPLAATINAGLTSSTLLTLLVMPSIYRVLTSAFEREADPPAPPAGPAEPAP